MGFFVFDILRYTEQYYQFKYSENMKKKILLTGLLVTFGLTFTPHPTLALSPPIPTQKDFTLPLLSQIVKDSGLDMGKFQKCMSAGTWTESITRSIQEAESIPVYGVPETFIFTQTGLVYRTIGSETTALDTLLSELQTGKTPSAAAVSMPGNYSLPNSNEPGWGDENAPVHLVVYVDLVCPFCRKYDQALVALEEKYQGFIQITYRDYPLVQMHKQSFLLAHVANCAMDQDKYWEFIKQIYRWTPVTKEFEVYGISEPANRGLYTLTEPKPGQQKLEVFNWFTGTSKVVAENLDALFPELAEEGVVMELIAEPIYPDSAMRYAFFQAKNPTTELQPATNFYKLDKVTGVINRMKISTLLPANTGNMVVNNTENKLAWSPIKSNGLARELYVFDLIKDTRTLVKTLPTNQTFYKNTEDLRNFSSDFEWFDDKTIGYQTYNSNTKALVTKGLVKLK